MSIPTGKLLVPTGKLLVPTDKLLVPTAGLLVPTAGLLVPIAGLLLPIAGLLVPTDKLLVPTDKLLVPTDKLLVPTDKMLVPIDRLLVPTDSGGRTKKERSPVLRHFELSQQAPLFSFFRSGLAYSARSLFTVSSSPLAVWSEKPWNLSTTIPFLLITNRVGMERSPYSVCRSSPAMATG